MKLIIFSVHDSKAAAFISPFFCPTVAVGLRSFAQAASDTDTQFCKFPGDYTLFELGTFDVNTGEISLLKAMKNHGLAVTHQIPEWRNFPEADLGEAAKATSQQLRLLTDENERLKKGAI